MSPMITSGLQLQVTMSEDIRDAVDEVTRLILTKLQDIIMEVVYTPYDPNEYDRQYDAGLLGAWLRDAAKIEGNTVTGRIDSDPMHMILNQEQGIHGSLGRIKDEEGNYEEAEGIEWDIREYLMDMIINGGDASKHPHVGKRYGSGFWTQPRDFWTPFEAWFNENAGIMLKMALQIRGLNII